MGITSPARRGRAGQDAHVQAAAPRRAINDAEPPVTTSEAVRQALDSVIPVEPPLRIGNAERQLLVGLALTAAIVCFISFVVPAMLAMVRNF